jgi:hypothetical protein
MAINPLLMFGMNSSVGYGPFNLEVDFTGGTLFSFYQSTQLLVPFQADHNTPRWLLIDSWHQADPFDDQSEWIPGRYPPIRRGRRESHPNHSTPIGRNSDFWKTNAQYLRLRRVQLSYDVPANIRSRVGFDQLRVYSSIANAFTLDNLGHLRIDPEISGSGGTTYPTQRVVNIGFSTAF